MNGRVCPALLLALAACVPGLHQDDGSGIDRWSTIRVANQYPTGVVLYPSLSGTTIWERIDRVPAHATRTVRVPTTYLGRDFRLVVCAASGALGEARCARTNRYLNQGVVPELVIFPTPRLHAELYGDD